MIFLIIFFVDFTTKQISMLVPSASYPNHSYHGEPSYQCTVKPFFGMAKRMELCMEEEPLHVTPPYKPHP
jgi:hypothetical protein